MQTSLAFALKPRLADMILWIASLKARISLKEGAPIRVLLDSNIRTHAVTHQEIWIDTGTVMWGGVHPCNTGGFARVPVYSSDNATREYEDICYLGGLLSLVRPGYMEFLTSTELIAEQERHPPSRFNATSLLDFSLLDLVNIRSVDGESAQFLIESKLSRLGAEEIHDFQINRINNSNDDLFRKIMDLFRHSNHSQDAWHIRTAVCYKCDYFLTMDRKIINLFEQHQKKLEALGVTCRVVSPKMLGRHLKVRKVRPKYLSYLQPAGPVRDDLHLPNEKRSSQKKGSISDSNLEQDGFPLSRE